MKPKASGAHQQVSNVADQEGRVMAIFQTASDAAEATIDEQQIRESIDDFGYVGCVIVILQRCQLEVVRSDKATDFFTPVQC